MGLIELVERNIQSRPISAGTVAVNNAKKL
jgi:hypothetical protein